LSGIRCELETILQIYNGKGATTLESQAHLVQPPQRFCYVSPLQMLGQLGQANTGPFVLKVFLVGLGPEGIERGRSGGSEYFVDITTRGPGASFE
jgi:hypothetical protein